MQMLAKKMMISATLLGMFAIVGTGLVALTYENTREIIAQKQRETLLESLHALVKPEQHDNDMFTDRIVVRDTVLLGSKEDIPVYRARMHGQPVALVLSPIAPDGYSGDIKLMVAINYDGSLAGVRVVSHHETPGLGDKIELERSDWIHAFAGRSLTSPVAEKWKVKKDGGIFDQFTGATITPRAVVKAVHNTLRYYDQHRDELYGSGTKQDSVEGQQHG